MRLFLASAWLLLGLAVLGWQVWAGDPGLDLHLGFQQTGPPPEESAGAGAGGVEALPSGRPQKGTSPGGTPATGPGWPAFGVPFSTVSYSSAALAFFLAAYNASLWAQQRAEKRMKATLLPREAPAPRLTTTLGRTRAEFPPDQLPRPFESRRPDQRG
jgi:hypothetical protein